MTPDRTGAVQLSGAKAEMRQCFVEVSVSAYWTTVANGSALQAIHNSDNSCLRYLNSLLSGPRLSRKERTLQKLCLAGGLELWSSWCLARQPSHLQRLPAGGLGRRDRPEQNKLPNGCDLA
jgi:hypothetical protein